MSKNFSVLTEDGIEHYEVIPGLDRASSALVHFVEFIRKLHPKLSPNESGWLTALVVHNLPGLIMKSPHLQNAIKQAAEHIKSQGVDNVSSRNE